MKKYWGFCIMFFLICVSIIIFIGEKIRDNNRIKSTWLEYPPLVSPHSSEKNLSTSQFSDYDHINIGGVDIYKFSIPYHTFIMAVSSNGVSITGIH